jgi:membrane-associated phospholipid phosphatase
MRNCPAANERFSALAWQVTLGMAILVVVWFNIVGLHVSVHVTPDMMAYVPGYIFLIVYCRLIWRKLEIARMLIAVGQLTIVIIMGLMLSYAASTVPLPYREPELLALDRWLGFEREAYMAFLKQHTRLRDVLYFAYTTIMHQTLLVCIVPLVARRLDRLQAYIIGFAFAVTTTAVIASLIPAANALIYVDNAPTDMSTLPDGGHSYFPTLEGLRAGTLRVINFGGMEGLISFPSFHTANAILFVWALWPIRLLRLPMLVLNSLLIASTPLAGAHYFVDLIGGTAVAFAAIFVTSRLVRDPPPGVTDASIIGPRNHKPDGMIAAFTGRSRPSCRVAAARLETRNR